MAPPLRLRPDVRKVQNWLDTWDGPVTFSCHELDVKAGGDLGVAYGYLRLAGKKRGATEPADFWLRGTLTLERVQSRWRIVHEHHSVPFHMDGSLRPAFDLKPEA